MVRRVALAQLRFGRWIGYGACVAGVGLFVTSCQVGPAARGGGDSIEPLNVSQVHVVGTAEAIADVRDLEVLPDGSVWLLNSSPPLFVGFGPDGRALEAHGTPGGGPEEFSLPSAFITGSLTDHAWILDLRRHSFIRASAPGLDREEIPLPRATVPPGSVVGGHSLLTTTVRTEQLGAEILVPRTGASMRDGISTYRMAALQPDLVALDPANATTREILSLRTAIEDPSAGFEPTVGGFPLWYRLWTVCRGSTIRVYDRIRNTVRGFDAEGTEVGSLALPPKPFDAVTPRQFARAIFGLRASEVAGRVGGRLTREDSLRVMNDILEGVEGSEAELATYLPEYVDLRCDEQGGVWLQPIDLEKAGTQGGRTWLRVSESEVAQRVTLPERFDVFRFQGGRIWGVQRDELDVASVAWVANPALR